MTTLDFITELFCRVDDAMTDVRKHSQAVLWPSEVVTLGLLHALKGAGNQAFYRWLERNYPALFPHLPERTRLFRLFKTHQAWTFTFLAKPTLRSLVDSFGIELIHPIREKPQPSADRAERRIQSALDCRRQTLPSDQSSGRHHRLGMGTGHRGERNDRMLIEKALSMLTPSVP